jgi:hypothetical protein
VKTCKILQLAFCSLNVRMHKYLKHFKKSFHYWALNV